MIRKLQFQGLELQAAYKIAASGENAMFRYTDRDALKVTQTQIMMDGIVITQVDFKDDAAAGYESGLDAYGFWGVLSGQSGFITRHESYHVSEGQGLAMNLPNFRTSQAYGTSSHGGFRILGNELHRELEEWLGYRPRKRIEFVPRIDLRARSRRQLLSVEEVVTTVFENHDIYQKYPLAIQSLNRTIMRSALEGFTHNYSDSINIDVATGLPVAVAKAIEFMREHYGRMIRPAEVAAAAGLNLRALQSSFLYYEGKTIGDYLSGLRLAHLRRDLLDPANDKSIKETAFRWGFTRGRELSEAYFRLFGELPTHTVTRSRG